MQPPQCGQPRVADLLAEPAGRPPQSRAPPGRGRPASARLRPARFEPPISSSRLESRRPEQRPPGSGLLLNRGRAGGRPARAIVIGCFLTPRDRLRTGVYKVYRSPPTELSPQELAMLWNPRGANGLAVGRGATMRHGSWADPSPFCLYASSPPGSARTGRPARKCGSYRVETHLGLAQSCGGGRIVPARASYFSGTASQRGWDCRVRQSVPSLIQARLDTSGLFV